MIRKVNICWDPKLIGILEKRFEDPVQRVAVIGHALNWAMKVLSLGFLPISDEVRTQDLLLPKEMQKLEILDCLKEARRAVVDIVWRRMNRYDAISVEISFYFKGERKPALTLEINVDPEEGRLHTDYPAECIRHSDRWEVL